MWIKVWTLWAWGASKEYDYHEVGNDSDIENIIDNTNDHNEWSDKYRGAKYEVIEAPPVKWLINEIKTTEERAAYAIERAEYLKKLLKKIEIPLPH